MADVLCKLYFTNYVIRVDCISKLNQKSQFMMKMNSLLLIT